ncbi:hypothetical protein DACRYDRAFT_106316 [Dacryopinax primogenitus]|uniref:RNI-like protein n=1 Tax=Dacryopinax primogenitus (strain DJM 731) TaxID=1858805 RepID=M5GEC2_DACPD|nr:uncharacterized protein DACRYDRAFT_106316 [Dacryopinax primogenitus]EJU03143.1 hypothetical protein DACRYDRAFT_106316 [Dacryopinax primogenitus]
MPQLHHLTLNPSLRRYYAPIEVIHLPTRAAFQTLRSFRLTSITYTLSQSPLPRLLTALSSSMEAVTLGISAFPELVDVIETISSQWSETIQEISLEVLYQPPLLHPHLTLEWSALTPLLACRNLKVLEIDLGNPVELTDSRVSLLAGALPHLRILHIHCTRCLGPSEYIPTATVHSLAVLACLENLTDLSLDVNLGCLSLTSEDIQKAANPRIKQFRSDILGGHSSIEVIKERVRRLFPSLGVVLIVPGGLGPGQFSVEGGEKRKVAAWPAKLLET